MKTPIVKQQPGVYTTSIGDFIHTILKCKDGRWRCFEGVPAAGFPWRVFIDKEMPAVITSSKLHDLRKAVDELNASFDWSNKMNLSQNLMSICVAADMLGPQDVHVGDVVEAVLSAIDVVDQNNNEAVAAAVQQQLCKLEGLEPCGADLLADILGEIDRHDLLNA